MAEQTGSLKKALTAVTGTAVGGALKVQNDFGGDVIITDLILDITTEATGSATVDAGVDDGGDVSSDNLLDGLDVGAASGVFDNTDNGGSNGGRTVVWPEDEYLVITASATLAGLVGNAHIKYVRR